MPLQVRVKNFQSISDATIEVDGLTVITGPNNSGKTALVRAVSGAFTNPRGHKFVRYGKEHSTVEITFSDGRRVVWEKGAKVNRYEVDGKGLDKVGQGVPPEVQALGVTQVEAGGRELWPQLAQQFVGQVFLIDAPGSVLAEAVADVDKVGLLNESLRLAQSDRRSAASELKVRKEDAARHEASVRRFDGLDEAVLKIRKAEETAQRLSQDRARLEQLKALQSRIATVESLVKKLSPVRDLPKVNDTIGQKLPLAEAKLVQLRAIRDRISGVGAIVVKLTPVRSLPAVSDTTGPKLMAANEKFGQLKVLSKRFEDVKHLQDRLAPVRQVRVIDDAVSTRVRKIESALAWAAEVAVKVRRVTAEFEQAKRAEEQLRSRSLPELAAIETGHGHLSEVLQINKRLADARAAVDSLRSRMDSTHRERLEAEREVQSLLGEVGECPFCGANHEASAC